MDRDPYFYAGNIYAEACRSGLRLRDAIAPECSFLARSAFCRNSDDVLNPVASDFEVRVTLLNDDASVHVSVEFTNGNVPAALVELTKKYHDAVAKNRTVAPATGKDAAHE